MTERDAYKHIKNYYRSNPDAVDTVINWYYSDSEIGEEISDIAIGTINSTTEVSNATWIELPRVVQRIREVLSPPSATTQEQMVKKEGPVTTRTAETRGDNSDQQQSVEQTRPNGLTTDTDQAHHNVCTASTNNDHSTQDRTKSTGGDEGSDTGGAKSEREAEKSVIVTSPNVVQNNPVAAANDARKEITAAKSGFNDNRDDSLFSIVDELLSIPGDILAAITKVDEKKDRQAENDGDLEGASVYTSIMADIGKEMGKITKSVAMFTADSAKEKAEAVIKNKKEKIKKMEERIEKMKEGATKNKFKTALLNLDFSILFADPSSENKDKKSIRDKDEEVNMAVKATEKALNAEANIN